MTTPTPPSKDPNPKQTQNVQVTNTKDQDTTKSATSPSPGDSNTPLNMGPSTGSHESVISAGDFQSIQGDLDIMLDYAIKHGIQIPTTISTDRNPDAATVIANYNTLITTIAPATVESIRYIDSQIFQDGKTRKWYQIPIFSRSLILAGIALVALILISLHPDINEANQASGLLGSTGSTLLLNVLFIISASLLGVMFFLLKTINTKIRNYSLLPVDGIEISSMIQIGIISGFVISELFTISSSAISNTLVVNRMTLALIGGFSSDAIFSILQGVVNKIKEFLTPGS